jgi:hypothetical protein
MLAYLFWHEPRADVDPDAYEVRLRAFHRALVAAPPPSFVRSWSVRLAVAPWDAGPARRPFEDWYLVEDWAALGTLNEAAVRAPREDAHDAIAALATNGAGGLYLVQHGTLDGPAPWAGWVVKPPGEPYATFEPRLRAAVDAAGGGAVLRRQMVLGPAPEYALLAAREPALPWPVRATGPRKLTDGSR